MPTNSAPKGLTPEELSAWFFEQNMQEEEKEGDDSTFKRDLRIKR